MTKSKNTKSTTTKSVARSSRTKTREDIVAVPNYQDDTLTGAIFWWHLEGEINAEAFKAAWEAAGFDEAMLPTSTSPAQALQCTAKEFCEKRRLARPLAGHAGWALVSEDATGNDLDYGLTCRMSLDLNDQVEVKPASHPLAEKIEANFKHLQKVYMHWAVSIWLTKTAERCLAVRLRETGGIFFVPKTMVEQFKKYVEVLQEVSACQVYEVPAMRSDEAVEAVLAAVTREAEAEVEKMDAALAGDMGARALDNRATRCQEMLTYVESYEQLLGQGLDELKKRIEGLKANLVAAALAAGAEEDAKE
jgi:hypothetical protein